MPFHPERVESNKAAKQFEFETQLEADLATGIRGGNKARLIARCFVACVDFDNRAGADPKGGQLINTTYEEFRATHIGKTFAQLHEAFDQVLPAKYRAK